jgi:endonuclease III
MTQQAVVQGLLDRYGRTFAEEAGIRLSDQPSPLYQLLVLSTLVSARISSEIAVAGARELFAAGYRTAKAMSAASWNDRVHALDRSHYRRNEARTATMLGEGAELLTDRWRGDLRRLHDEAGGDVRRVKALLTTFPGIGPVGADIFLREVQATWPDVAPYFDSRVLDGARKLALPDDPRKLAKLAGPASRLPNLAAALVRVALSHRPADELVAAGASTA